MFIHSTWPFWWFCSLTSSTICSFSDYGTSLWTFSFFDGVSCMLVSLFSSPEISSKVLFLLWSAPFIATAFSGWDKTAFDYTFSSAYSTFYAEGITWGGTATLGMSSSGTLPSGLSSAKATQCYVPHAIWTTVFSSNIFGWRSSGKNSFSSFRFPKT